MIGLCACTGSPQTQGENTENNTPAPPPATDDTETGISVKQDFRQINNFAPLDIEWHAGPCSVTFIGDERMIGFYDIEADDGGLTIFQQTEGGEAKPRLRITSPTLMIVSNYESGTVRLCGSLQTDELVVGNVGGGRIETDSVSCRKFEYSSSAASAAKFSFIRADDVLVVADGTGTTDLNLDAGHLNLQAWGTQTIILNGHADTHEITVSPTNMVNNLLQ